MPFIVAILVAAAGAYFYFNRARRAADIASDLVDVANDVRLAARRFGFRNKANTHPADSIDDNRVAIAALAAAFVELDGMPTQEQHTSIVIALSRQFACDSDQSKEMLTLGRWLVSQCGGPQPAIARLTRRLYKIAGVGGLEPLMSVIKAVAESPLSPRQGNALDEIRIAMRLR